MSRLNLDSLVKVANSAPGLRVLRVGEIEIDDGAGPLQYPVMQQLRELEVMLLFGPDQCLVSIIPKLEMLRHEPVTE